jgi:transglycosylase-like protein/putative peptidoglycan binding protein
VPSHRDLSSPTASRRSLRASRDRRRAARRRRIVLRGRAGAALAVGLSALVCAGAPAQGTTSSKAPAATRSAGVRALQRALGVPADGVYGPVTRRAVRRFQRAHGLVVDGIAGPRTRAALGLGAVAATGGAAAVGASTTLQRIAQCESGGNPTALSAGGTYRGKYQFTRSTWRAMGGVGDPAAAPEAVQDRIAARLLSLRGTAPWPRCGGA